MSLCSFLLQTDLDLRIHFLDGSVGGTKTLIQTNALPDSVFYSIIELLAVFTPHLLKYVSTSLPVGPKLRKGLTAASIFAGLSSFGSTTQSELHHVARNINLLAYL